MFSALFSFYSKPRLDFADYILQYTTSSDCERRLTRVAQQSLDRKYLRLDPFDLQTGCLKSSKPLESSSSRKAIIKNCSQNIHQEIASRLLKRAQMIPNTSFALTPASPKAARKGFTFRSTLKLGMTL